MDPRHSRGPPREAAHVGQWQPGQRVHVHEVTGWTCWQPLVRAAGGRDGKPAVGLCGAVCEVGLGGATCLQMPRPGACLLEGGMLGRFLFFFKFYLFFKLEYKVVLVVKNPPVNTGDIKVAGSTPRSARSPGGGHGNHSSLLAWRMPWREEPGGLQSMGSHRVGCD